MYDIALTDDTNKYGLDSMFNLQKRENDKFGQLCSSVNAATVIVTSTVLVRAVHSGRQIGR